MTSKLESDILIFLPLWVSYIMQLLSLVLKVLLRIGNLAVQVSSLIFILFNLVSQSFFFIAIPQLPLERTQIDSLQLFSASFSSVRKGDLLVLYSHSNFFYTLCIVVV
ncbi:unnamed protein product [Mucor circinelloides]